MLLVDRLLLGGVRFVLERLLDTIDEELARGNNDAGQLRERLLDAQLRLEEGQLDLGEFEAIEAEVLAALRAQREEGGALAIALPRTSDDAGYRIVGAEAEITADSVHEPFLAYEPALEPPVTPRATRPAAPARGRSRRPARASSTPRRRKRST